MGTLTIGKLAGAAAVGVDTVRFYEHAGLLNTPRRTPGGYRLYEPDDVDRLRFIRRAKSIGFSLDEIAELLRLNDGGGRRSSVRKVAQARLAETERKLKELTAISEMLRHLIHRCHGEGGLTGCPIIEAVLATAPRTTPRTRRSA